MTSAFTQNLNLEQPANGDDVDTWDVPVNGNMSIVDAARGGRTSINVTAAVGTVTLSASQYQKSQIAFTGTRGAVTNYQLPSGVGGTWPVSDATTGAFALTFSSAGGGTSVTVPQGGKVNIKSDGTNITVYAAQPGANTDITSLGGLTTPLTVAQGGTGVATLSGLLKGAGTSAVVAATAGADYAKPDTASTWTATQTLSGGAATFAEKLTNAKEPATVSATAAAGTISYYLGTQSILYYTSNAAANWTVNLTFALATSLDSAMSAGECATAVFMVTQGSTAYYNSAVQVDGVSVTPKWLGGPPAGGNASGVDVYTYAIVKTGAATFSVFASAASFST